MAHAILIKGGGGIGGSDEVTVYQKDIPKGLTAITADSDDEVVEGSLETTVSDETVLSGETYYNTNTHNKSTGTMANYAGVTKSAKSAASNGNNIDITVNDAGYYTNTSKIQASKSSVATAGGLTAAKMLGGQSAFGISGTALNDATIDSNADMLSGVVAYGKNGTKYTGSIASQAGITFTPSNKVQYGNYKGKYMTGNITVNAVANLTASNILKGKTVGGVAGTATSDATALVNTIINGYTAYVNGSKITGTVNVQTILSFSAAPYSPNKITFTWKNPAKGAFSGVIIVGKTGSTPTSISDGTRWYKGSGNNTTANGTSTITVDGFTGGTQYYFRAFSYATKNNSEWVGSSLTSSAKTKPQGTQVFTSSGTFTVPTEVTSIDIFCVGGGGAGGGTDDEFKYHEYDDVYGYYSGAAGGGAGGYTATKLKYAVTPGQTFTVTIGAGAPKDNFRYSNNSYYFNYYDGYDTSFGSVLTAKGGESGRAGNFDAAGGSGGSGGGCILSDWDDGLQKITNGGSDGSSAGIDSPYIGSTAAAGQGTTTRAFGESSGTLYAGGGGAIGYYGSSSAGAGGGGSANTGGGSNGRFRYYSYSAETYTFGGSGGGSGVCIVRWGY